MPPSNNTFATASTIGSFPFDFTQLDINDGGVNFTVYYRFIAPVNSRVIGAWGFSGNIGAGYRPTIKPYNGPAGAPTQILSIGVQNKPIQFPVVPGNEYFLEFVKNIDTAGPEDLRVQVEVAPLSTVATGNILVNDDSNGFPLAILSHLVDHTVINFVKDFAFGEGGDILATGISAWERFLDNTIRVYNSSFGEIGNLAHSAGDPRIRTCHGQNKFFVGINRNPSEFRDILPTGAFGSINKTMTGVTSLLGFAVSNDGLIIYFSNSSSGSAIKRWDIVPNVALSDLVAGIAGRFIVDILVLNDNTIVALYEQTGSGEVIVRRYNSSGTLLNTYSTLTNREPAGTFARLAYAVDNPNSFWIMFHPGGSETGIARFLNIKTSDGTILTTRNQTEYEVGIYEGAETATPTARFGNSFSCPFMIMQGSLSGIYFINPNKAQQHDSYYGDVEKKIPNPIWRTALVGE